jgi:prepilin-type N-terminal cleavage/methylation domain-containing protein
MLTRIQSRRSGFTLVEIMIVVAIIALLAAIAVPSFLRARKRSQATTALETARLIDAAKDQYAIENGKNTLTTPNWNDLFPYVKAGSSLYIQLAAGQIPTDVLQNSFVMNNIDVPPQVSSLTEAALSDVLPNPSTSFWGSYY